ncbi:MAG: sigma 54-interacting transcriptional regulator [Bilophila sp.]
MLKLKEDIRRLAGSGSTVLISGESGTGKELVARAIHAASERRDCPFIGINCGAIPDALLESELFGYAGGAFTGASARGRIGKFELAHRGVLFLDEIGTMPLSLQVKLLRVLQERAFTRLGSNRLIEVDIRIIAAANEDLAEAVRQGRFREDLFYRLNVIPLHVPPLRERRDDIGPLSEHFLARYSARFGKPRPTLGPGMEAVLGAHVWPGNVREFENVMEYLVNMAPADGVLRPDMLPPSVRGASAAFAEKTVPPHALDHALEGGPLLPLRELERRAILEAVRRCGDDTPGKKAAAAALGIGVATLYRKLKEYGEKG